MAKQRYAREVKSELDWLIDRLDRSGSAAAKPIAPAFSDADGPHCLYGIRTDSAGDSPFADYWVHAFPDGTIGTQSADEVASPDAKADSPAALGGRDHLDGDVLFSRLYGGWRAAETSRATDAAPPPVCLWGPVIDEVLPMLARSGRLFRLESESAAPHPNNALLFDEHPNPWSLALRAEKVKGQDAYRFCGVLVRGRDAQERLFLGDAHSVAFHRQGWMIHEGVLSRFSRDHAVWLSTLRQSDWVIDIRGADLLEFLGKVGGQWRLPRLLDTECLPWTITQGVDPVPVLHARHSYSSHGCGLLFDYAGVLIRKEETQEIKEARDHRGHLTGYVIRRLKAEAARIRELEELNFAGTPDQSQWTISDRHAPSAFADLIAKGWRIETLKDGASQPTVVRNMDWSLVSSGIDWFDLQGVSWGELSESISAKVFDLLKCIENKSCFVHVPGQGALLITDELKRFLKTAEAVGRPLDGKLQIQPDLVGLLLATDGEATSPAENVLKRASAELDDFKVIQPVDPAPSFAGELREYQKAGLGWFHFLRKCGLGGCLADDMGLGKTVQVIAMLDEHRSSLASSGGTTRPSLVVAPLTLLGNWFGELRKFAPQLRVHIHHGSGRFASARHFGGFDVILTTYGLVHSDIGWLAQTPFEYVVVDEAHQIRNPQAKCSAAMKRLDCRHRLALTGTPIINYARDLKSLFDFLSPGLVHAIPDLAEFLRNGGPLSEEEALKIGRFLRPFILRRTKTEVLKELPAKTETLLYCDLAPDERETYNGLRDAFRRELLQGIRIYGMNQQRMHVLAALMRLRQLACHPGMIDPARQMQAGGKLAVLVDELEQVLAEGHKVLVFSNFVSFLQIIRSHLQADGKNDQVLYLDGSTKNRTELVDQFQTDPDKRIFLISIKAGGLGLNLTAADYVYIADPWWNSAIENQAIDRVHRIGQDKPVFAYRLIARDTIEEKIMELQSRKSDLADLILDEKNANPASLTREDVEFLLS